MISQYSRRARAPTYHAFPNHQEFSCMYNGCPLSCRFQVGVSDSDFYPENSTRSYECLISWTCYKLFWGVKCVMPCVAVLFEKKVFVWLRSSMLHGNTYCKACFLALVRVLVWFGLVWFVLCLFVLFFPLFFFFFFLFHMHFLHAMCTL